LDRKVTDISFFFKSFNCFKDDFVQTARPLQTAPFRVAFCVTLTLNK
jgi:hypothetical protein